MQQRLSIFVGETFHSDDLKLPSDSVLETVDQFIEGRNYEVGLQKFDILVVVGDSVGQLTVVTEELLGFRVEESVL